MLLKLNNFGKFKNKSFEISDFITLFYGANESGKTTIFDSLMYLFSENKKSLGFSKMIKNRYGDEIDVESVPAIDDSIKLHPDSYNNLYAIRQSEIIFNMSDNKRDSKEWESEIKKKLFSSDIDIGKMISEIRAEYSGRAQSSIPYQINLMENKNVFLQAEGYTNDLLQVSGANNMKRTSLVYFNPQSVEIGEEVITLSIDSTNEALTFPIFDKLIDKKIRITVEVLDEDATV